MNFFNLWQSFCVMYSIKLIIYILRNQKIASQRRRGFLVNLKKSENETEY